MSEKKWTPMQQLAIDTRDKTLLVSAAAGSGKTATLTERIVRSITDEINPLSIGDMLIVTFTRAAAAELRERIGAAIRKAAAARPGDAHLEHQLHILPGARICTIDSFCTDILRANADRVGVSQSFRIPDEAEAALLAENLLNSIIARIYEGQLSEVATPDELSSLADCLTDTGSEEDLAAIIAMLFYDTSSMVDGVNSLLHLIEEYNPDNFTRVENTRFGAYVMERLHGTAREYLGIFESAADEVAARAEKKLAKLADMIADRCDLCKRILATTEYTAARELLVGYKFSSAASNTDPTLPPTTTINKRLRAEIEKLTRDFFGYTEEDWRIAYTGLYRELSTLVRIEQRFADEFRREKIRRNICEFADISRFTHEILWQNGELTDVALSQRDIYSAVYIDEYQDVNTLQDSIFRAISRDDNRFMVGDIKQCIYCFRNANPDIFADMKRRFPEVKRAGGSKFAAIFMSDNFRCDEGIIDFVNLIFDRVFGLIGDSIGYVSDDRLRFSKMYDGKKPDYRKPEVCLVDSSALRDMHKEDADWSESEIAPHVVAQKIYELCENEKKNDGTPITPGDIAIIMRSAKSRAAVYKSALEEYGIPAAVAEQTTFFLTPEALLALSLLNAIDNPEKDIYLAGLMMSPLYSFTADELVMIEREGGASLWQRLALYVEKHPEFKKGIDFRAKLEHFRALAEGMPTDVLLYRLYSETGILALAAKKGTKDRLYRLYDYARTYERSSFKGLYNFISYVNGIIERKNSLDKREAPDDPNAVSIITSHASKGLEYPVVFYVGGEAQMGGGQSSARFEYHQDFGIGMYLRTPSGLALVKNPTKTIIKDYAERREFEEETRILYVTLTRARERLYVVGLAGKKWSDYEKEREYMLEYMSPHSIYSVGSLLKLLTFSAPMKLSSPDEFLREVPPSVSFDPNAALTTKVYIPKTAEEPRDEFILNTGRGFGYKEPPTPVSLSELLDERFSYVYPMEHLSRLPEKMSVSVLYPRLLDGSEEGVTELFDTSAEFEDNTELEYGKELEATDGSSKSNSPDGTAGEASNEFDGAAGRASNESDSTAGEASNKSDGTAHRGLEESDGASLHFAGLGILPDFLTGRERHIGAKRGIATHMLLQFCDLDNLHQNGSKAELDRLIGEKFLSPRDGERVRLREVELFRRSRLLADMRTAKAVYREFRFNVKLPASMFATDERARALYGDESVLVQGVIDCLYEDADGELHLVDYKTDRLSREELDDPELARKKLKDAHGLQLYYYGEAVKRIFGKEPVTREVYSLPLGDTLSVK